VGEAQTTNLLALLIATIGVLIWRVVRLLRTIGSAILFAALDAYLAKREGKDG